VLRNIRSECGQLVGNVGKFDAAAVSITEYEALKQMEQQRQPGTPVGHRNVRSYFNML